MSSSTVHTMNTMTVGPIKKRLEYPALAIFLLGGVTGSGINAAVVASLYLLAGTSAPLAFFCGTMANLLFHHVYYHFIFINREIQCHALVAPGFALLCGRRCAGRCLGFNRLVGCTVLGCSCGDPGDDGSRELDRQPDLHIQLLPPRRHRVRGRRRILLL